MICITVLQSDLFVEDIHICGLQKGNKPGEINPLMLFIGLHENNCTWSIDFTKATSDECIVWRIADITGRIYRAYCEDRVIIFLGEICICQTEAVDMLAERLRFDDLCVLEDSHTTLRIGNMSVS